MFIVYKLAHVEAQEGHLVISKYRAFDGLGLRSHLDIKEGLNGILDLSVEVDRFAQRIEGDPGCLQKGQVLSHVLLCCVDTGTKSIVKRYSSFLLL